VSRFEGYAKEFIVTALERTPADAVSDIYVVSLFVSDERDNPGRPTVTVGFNTESRVASTTHAGDADEARWNVAFWLQNDLGALAGSERDSTGASLGDDWLRTVAPRQPDEPVGATDCDGEETSAHFVQLLVVITKQLHADGTIARLFGRPIPVLIHELEYYDEIAEQNLRRLR
jgi:hypothetical protein